MGKTRSKTFKVRAYTTRDVWARARTISAGDVSALSGDEMKEWLSVNFALSPFPPFGSLPAPCHTALFGAAGALASMAKRFPGETLRATEPGSDIFGVLLLAGKKDDAWIGSVAEAASVLHDDGMPAWRPFLSLAESSARMPSGRDWVLWTASAKLLDDLDSCGLLKWPPEDAVEDGVLGKAMVANPYLIFRTAQADGPVPDWIRKDMVDSKGFTSRMMRTVASVLFTHDQGNGHTEYASKVVKWMASNDWLFEKISAKDIQAFVASPATMAAFKKTYVKRQPLSGERERASFTFLSSASIRLVRDDESLDATIDDLMDRIGLRALSPFIASLADTAKRSARHAIAVSAGELSRRAGGIAASVRPASRRFGKS